MDSKPVKQLKSKRFWYSIMPLLLMIGIIVIINLLSPNSVESEFEGSTPTAVASQADIATDTNTRPPILQATILPSRTPTTTPPLPLPAEAAIVLFGPPAESILPGNGRIAFYWTYSETIQPGQELVLTLRQNEAIIATAAVSQPNFGAGFQAVVDLGEVATPGTAVWQIHLQEKGALEPLLTSETRSLTLLSEG